MPIYILLPDARSEKVDMSENGELRDLLGEFQDRAQARAKEMQAECIEKNQVKSFIANRINPFTSTPSLQINVHANYQREKIYNEIVDFDLTDKKGRALGMQFFIYEYCNIKPTVNYADLSSGKWESIIEEISLPFPVYELDWHQMRAGKSFGALPSTKRPLYRTMDKAKAQFPIIKTQKIKEYQKKIAAGKV